MADMNTGAVLMDGQPPLPTEQVGPPTFDGGQMGPMAPGMQPGQQFSAENGIPRFRIEAVRQANGSFANVEFVEILTPGDNKAAPDHKVNDTIRQIYRPYYELWRAGVEQAPEGTPLEMWPILTPAEVQVFKVNNIFTVEQLVSMAEAHDHRIPMAKTLKQKARVWLEEKGSADSIEQNRIEKEAMASAIARLEAQNLAMADQLADLAREKAKQGTPEGETAGAVTSAAPPPPVAAPAPVATPVEGVTVHEAPGAGAPVAFPPPFEGESVAESITGAMAGGEEAPPTPAKRGPGRPRKTT